jgi:hypothetical protein
LLACLLDVRLLHLLRFLLHPDGLVVDLGLGAQCPGALGIVGLLGFLTRPSSPPARVFEPLAGGFGPFASATLGVALRSGRGSPAEYLASRYHHRPLGTPVNSLVPNRCSRGGPIHDHAT